MIVQIIPAKELLKHRRRIGKRKDDGKLHAPIESLWDMVKEWAKENGKVYNPSYGVEDVAAC